MPEETVDCRHCGMPRPVNRWCTCPADQAAYARQATARRELMPAELIEQVKAERRAELLNAGRWVRVGKMEVRLAD